jgi:hypothetical protein
VTDWNPIAGQDPVDRLDLDEHEPLERGYHGPCLWCGFDVIDGECGCGGVERTDES